MDGYNEEVWPAVKKDGTFVPQYLHGEADEEVEMCPSSTKHEGTIFFCDRDRGHEGWHNAQSPNPKYPGEVWSLSWTDEDAEGLRARSMCNVSHLVKGGLNKNDLVKCVRPYDHEGSHRGTLRNTTIRWKEANEK